MRWCWPQTGFIVLIMVLGVLSMLGGCGKKGPLYKADRDGPAGGMEQTRPAPGIGSSDSELALRSMPGFASPE